MSAHGLATIVRVLRAEGLRAVRDRALDRWADARRAQGFRPIREAEAVRFPARVLNVLATPPSPRFGGVATQFLARIAHEERERPVAVLYPSGGAYRLELTNGNERARLEIRGAPLAPLRATDAAFEQAVRVAADRVGAGVVHVEGVAGLPAESLGRRPAGKHRLVSVHDFSLFCPRPHLAERPENLFCGYCRDLARCERCLRVDWPVPAGFQAGWRARGAALLGAADVLIYPSAFLRDRYLELFPGLDPDRQEVVEPGCGAPPMPPLPTHAPRAPMHVAYVGAVHAHKGAVVFEEMVRALETTPDLRFTVFGGGDPALLARLRRLPRVAVRGYYRAGSLPRLLREERVDLALLLSIVPESYGLTLDECRVAGVPVVAFDHGAVGERLRRDGGGRWVGPGEGAEGVVRMVRDSGASAAAMANAFWTRSPAEAAAAHLRLYRRFAARASRA